MKVVTVVTVVTIVKVVTVVKVVTIVTVVTVTEVLLNGWVLPIGGASSVEGLRSTGLPRLATNPYTDHP